MPRRRRSWADLIKDALIAIIAIGGAAGALHEQLKPPPEDAGSRFWIGHMADKVDQIEGRIDRARIPR